MKINKILFSLPPNSTYFPALTRAFSYLGIEAKLFDSRTFTLKEKIITVGFKKRELAIKYLNQRLLKTVSDFQPDLLLVLKGEAVLPETIEQIKHQGIITVNWFPDGMQVIDIIKKLAPAYDIFFHFDSFVSNYLIKEKFDNVAHLSYAADMLPTEPAPDFKKPRSYPISFIGSYFPIREKTFQPIANLGLKIWGNKSWQGSSLGPNYQGVCPVDDVDKILTRTSVAVNLHNQGCPNGANLRVFESSRAASCLLTDFKKDVAALYDIDKEFVVYHNQRELISKAKYLIENPKKAQEIGYRAYLRTKRENTYVHRIKEILKRL